MVLFLQFLRLTCNHFCVPVPGKQRGKALFITVHVLNSRMLYPHLYWKKFVKRCVSNICGSQLFHLGTLKVYGNFILNYFSTQTCLHNNLTN